MQYINPFSVLDIPMETNEVDSRILKRTKKRLLTEFELQETTTITLNGHEMDKNAILKIFKELEHSNLFQYHLMIAKQPLLNDFLEKGKLGLFREPDWHLPIFKDSDLGFISFLQPYFSEQFNQHFSKSSINHYRLNYQLLCQAGQYLPTSYEGGCFKNTYRALMEQVNKVEEISKRNYLTEQLISPFTKKDFIERMNLLPDYFIDVRINIGSSLETIALTMNNKYDKTQLAKKILRQGLKLKTNESCRYQLQYVLDQLNNQPEEKWGYGKPTDRARFRFRFNFSYGWIFILLFFIRMVVLFVGTNSSSNTYDTLDFNEKYFNQWEQTQKIGENDRSLVYNLIEHHINEASTDIKTYKTETLETDKNPFYGVPNLNRFRQRRRQNSSDKKTKFSILKIINESPWDVLLIYENSLITCAEYLPKGKNLKLKIQKGYAKLTAYAGNDWKPNFPLNKDYQGAFMTSHGIVTLPDSFINSNRINDKIGVFIHEIKIEKTQNNEMIKSTSSIHYSIN